MMYRKKQQVDMSKCLYMSFAQTLFDSFGAGAVLFSMMYHVTLLEFFFCKDEIVAQEDWYGPGMI